MSSVRAFHFTAIRYARQMWLGMSSSEFWNCKTSAEINPATPSGDKLLPMVTSTCVRAKREPVCDPRASRGGEGRGGVVWCGVGGAIAAHFEVFDAFE